MIPLDPPKLLPGRTANYLTRRWVYCLLLTLPGLPFIAASAVVGSGGPPLGGAGLLWILAWAAIGFRAAVSSARRERQEFQAGYTTLSGRGLGKYWQLDPQTGAVLRRPDRS